MNKTYDLATILELSSDKTEVRHYLGSSTFFNERILQYNDQAMRVWRNVCRRYTDKESDLHIPYRLAESPKLYAIDALTIASPLISNKHDVGKIAEFFCVFYLMVHYFDDHVEHRDKFYSKFDFSSENSLDTQRGAAPFSFSLVSMAILSEILDEIPQLNDQTKLHMIKQVYTSLALQTRYFAAERQRNLDIDEILDIKQRQVSGKSMSVLGTLVGNYLGYPQTTIDALNDGLMYLGSLTQITDDIRDLAIDTALKNANIVLACYNFGTEIGHKKLSDLYNHEVSLLIKSLGHLYDEDSLSLMLSLPFYPFMINKQRTTGDGA